MKGLILKDIYNLKVYLRQYTILLIFFMIFGITMGNSHYIMWMSLVLGINIGFSAFPADEAGGYAYMLACPVSRRICVRAKYLMHIFGAVFIFMCSLIGEVINCLLNGEITEGWVMEMACVLGIFFFFSSILVPVAYCFGVEKARVVLLGMIALPMVAAFLSVKIIHIDAITEMIDAFSRVWLFHYAAFIFLAACLLLFGGSYLLSAKIFEGKEF